MNDFQTTLPTKTGKGKMAANGGLPWTACRYALGVVLILAAALKAGELATLPLLSPGLLNQRWLIVLLVEVEAMLAGWLFIGVGGVWLWASTLTLWIVFVAAAGYEAISGANSCGCFGRIHVNPWYAASFDLCVLLGLPLCRPHGRTTGRQILHRAARWMIVGGLAVAGGAFGIWDIMRYDSGRLSEDGLTLATDGTVILEPAKWAGHPFVLANYIDIGSRLSHGDWVVLLYRNDCKHCQIAVSRYAALAGQSFEHVQMCSLAFVEMPPYMPTRHTLFIPSNSILLGRLSTAHDWFASTPIAVSIHDGRVQAVAEGDVAEDPRSLLNKISSVWGAKPFGE